MADITGIATACYWDFLIDVTKNFLDPGYGDLKGKVVSFLSGNAQGYQTTIQDYTATQLSFSENLRIPPSPGDQYIIYTETTPPEPKLGPYDGPGDLAETPTVAKTKDKKPTVQVYSTPKGHMIIMSDEENKRYLKVVDCKGNFVMFDTENNKILVFMNGEGDIEIRGDTSETIVGDYSKDISGNKDETVENNLDITIGGTESINVEGSSSHIYKSGINISVIGTCSITCTSSAVIQAPSVLLGTSGSKKALVNSDATSTFNGHTHNVPGVGETSGPNQTMGSGVLTSATQAN